MLTQNPKNILIAPLDWGLGHTTRCVPLIRHIRSLGHRVYVAGNQWQRSFITRTFPGIDTIDIEGYNVTYSRWNKFAQVGILSQLPGLVRTINAEHAWLQHMVKELNLHGIISDNRYGLFHPQVPSVILTHQLQVLTGMGARADRMVQKMHYKYLDRFNETWVVDTPAAPGLGGALSHPAILPSRSAFIGLLSQFDEAPLGDTDGSLLVLLSGPEPQRTDLSRILWKQVQNHNGKVIFVEGSNTAQPPQSIPPHITWHPWLANESLAPLLRAAGLVICRSGYSTLMDLVALHKKAILIPTPGQTEQEYLGKQLHQQGVYYSAKQNGFDLQWALKEAGEFPYNSMSLQGAYVGHKQVVVEWLQGL